METLTKPPRLPRREQVPASAEPSLEGHVDELPGEQALPKPRGAIVVFVAVVIVLVLAVALAVGLLPKLHRSAEFNAQAEAVASELPPVNVEYPRQSKAATKLDLPGSMQPLQETAIYARTTGYLKRWLFDYGAQVKAGQLLAEIDAPEVDEQLSQAKANLASDQANQSKAELDYTYTSTTAQRYDALIKTNSVTPQELDMYHANMAKARTAVATAKATVAADEANVKRLEDLQSFEKITAPFSGTITARNYDIGALITANGTAGIQPIFRLAETDVLRVWVNVPQSYATSIKLGQIAKLSVREFPGVNFQGKVTHTAGALDTASRTLLTEVQVSNPDGRLLAGMYCGVDFEVTNAAPPLIIPVSALISDSQGTQVAVVDAQGIAHYKSVTLGRDYGTTVEVLTGLEKTDKVVTNPGERLSDGVKVRIISEPKAESNSA